MIYHVTYADDGMILSAQNARKTALAFNMPSVYLRPHNIWSSFAVPNEEILKQKRGAGYWLWKPYIINRCIKSSSDWLLYTDAGIEIIADPKILTTVEDDILLFGNHYYHTHWCKNDVIRAINGFCDSSVLQVQASAMMFRPTKRAKDFVYEWLLWSQIPGFIDDSPSKSGNHPEFKEHRHDQAILTCLAEKYGIKRHWWPAVYNDGAFTYDKGTYTDDYPVIFHHHRKRNDEW
jgi:hypothetical protein